MLVTPSFASDRITLDKVAVLVSRLGAGVGKNVSLFGVGIAR